MKLHFPLYRFFYLICLTGVPIPLACQTPATVRQTKVSTDSLLIMKIDSRLLTAIREQKTGKIENAVPVILPEDSAGTVRLEIKAKVSDALIQFLRTSGATNLKSFSQFDLLQCGLPLSAIEKVAMRKDVDFLRPAPVMQLDNEPR